MSRHLGNWLRAYMEYTRDTESPDSYHFWTAISILGAITKRQVWMEMHYFQIYPNFYTILVGPSGARKSAAGSIGLKLGLKAGLRKFSDKITDAALIKDLSDATEKRVEGSNIQLCSPVLIYASELGVFMGLDAYSSGVIADLTDLYDCPKAWEKKTISRDSEMIIAPYVSFFGCTTPQTLKDVIPASAVGQGFTSRILFVWASRRRKRVPIPSWDDTHTMLENHLINDLKTIGKLKGPFTFSPEGLKAYKEFYNTRPEPEDEWDDERMRGYASRKDIHLLKVAMGMSLAEKDELVLTEKEIIGAIESLKWMEAGLPNVFAGHGAATTSQDVVRVFKQIEMACQRIGYMNKHDLVRRNYAQLGVTELDLVIKTLESADAITTTVTKDPITKDGVAILYTIKDKNFLQSSKGRKPRTLIESEED